MRNLAVGLLGYGHHSRAVQLPILLRMPGVRVVAIAEADSAARDAARQVAPEAACALDYRDVAQRTDLDAVVIALPNALHAPAAMMCLAAGTPVYVEKPLGITMAEAEQVRETAVGLICAVGFNYRFNRLYRAARRHIKEGHVGSVRRVLSVFSACSGALPAWKRERDTGGGALLDLASHHVDLTRFLFGDPIEAVRAKIRSVDSQQDVADLELSLEGGCTVSSRFELQGAPRERFEIEGELGSLVVDRRQYQDIVFTPTGHSSRERGGARFRQALRHLTYVLEKRRTPGHEPSHRIALSRFFDAVRTGLPFTPSAEDGVACLRIIEAAERSSRTGRIEPVDGGSL